MIDIIDVSGVLHTAKHVPGNDSKIIRGFPVSGVRHLMRMVTTSIMQGHGIILCFDKGKNPRKSIAPDYKKGRKFSADVLIQADFLIEKLQGCGIPCFYGEAESDDYIAKACLTYRDENNITVYGADKDLYANVSYTVSYSTVNVNTSNISANNFESIASTDKVYIPFNMILPYKVFCGDSSDCIKAYPKGFELFEEYKKFCIDYDMLDGTLNGTEECLNIFLDTKGLLEDEDLELRKRLIYPWEIVEDVYPVYKTKIDMDRLQSFLCLVYDRVSLRNLRLPFIEPSREESDELFIKAQFLAKGEYSVDNNLSLNEVNFDIEDIYNIKDL